MKEEGLLQEYGESFAQNLVKYGYVSFLDGHPANLRQQCLASGIAEKEVLDIEDRIVEKHFKTIAVRQRATMLSDDSILLSW